MISIAAVVASLVSSAGSALAQSMATVSIPSDLLRDSVARIPRACGYPVRPTALPRADSLTRNDTLVIRVLRSAADSTIVGSPAAFELHLLGETTKLVKRIEAQQAVAVVVEKAGTLPGRVLTAARLTISVPIVDLTRF